jgi:transcriptional regulator with XRE-family HTH domain
MVETIGQKLQRARSLRKLSLDDASRATKIRGRQLADLERDEYSNFPNLAYAKGFLISYGKFLNVDVRPYLDAFEDSNTFGLDNYQYLSEIPLGVYRATRRPARRRDGRRRYTALAAALGMLALAFFSWQLYVGYRRLGDLDKLADHQAAQERDSTNNTAGTAAVPAGPGAAVANDPVAAAAAALPPPVSFRGLESASPTENPHLPPLPVPDDGGAFRAMLPAAPENPGPFLVYADVPLPSPRPGLGPWTPENLDGYRFYIRNIDRISVEIFRIGVPRPETVSNNRF